LEIVLSGYVPLKVALPAMTGWHALIGIGEGVITAVVVSVVSKAQETKVGEERV
jgi:cobalt/nickel transport system permease protein